MTIDRSRPDRTGTGITRRDLLWTAVSAAALGTGLVAAPRTASGSPPDHPIRFDPSAPSVVARPSPRPGHRRPWERPWTAPISNLDDFVRRCPNDRFPRRAMMLTIDDGPSPEWTPKYLKLLAEHDILATFCMIGEQVGANKHLVRAVAADGHHIANHTWTHDEQLTYRSPGRIRRELVDTNDAIVRAAGVVPRQFRAPGGVWGRPVFAEVSRLHMMPLGWDIDPRDWARPGTAAIESALLAAGNHDIILCHDGGGDRSQTYAALESALPQLKRRGHEFVRLPAPQHL